MKAFAAAIMPRNVTTLLDREGKTGTETFFPVPGVELLWGDVFC
jgi:hypothetical protein